MPENIEIPLTICMPFVLVLLAIAIMPLVAPHFWEKNRNKAVVAAIFSLPVLIYLLLNLQHELLKTFEEYISFIILLGSLFVVSGGVLMRGDLQATPRNLSIFLLIGAVAANLVGTTGASMLMIRPLVKTISERRRINHIPVFFIFVVSNIGGCLTPLGDPPLFLGYLRGVPFEWTLQLFPEWLTALALVLGTFYIYDTLAYRKEGLADIIFDRTERQPIRFTGKLNFLFLLAILCAVLWAGTPYREAIMIAATVLSLVFTKKEVRTGNNFTFGPIIEVAVLFAGIFITMVPLLKLLELKGAALGVTEPWQFFWMTGGLSSFLDNAPTYLTFMSLAKSVTAAGNLAPAVAGVYEPLLKAISCGAVFMGANTYIGNGPNFMVKSIAEEQGVKMPHFFGYMLYSGAILIPIFLIITFIFFR